MMKGVRAVLAVVVCVGCVMTPPANAQLLGKGDSDPLPAAPLESYERNIAAPPQRCTDFEIVIAAGTGDSNQGDDPLHVRGLRPGSTLLADVDAAGGSVSAWQVPYTASVGVLGTLGETRTNMALPYGASLDTGKRAVRTHLATLHSACPDAKVLFLGFSQGAGLLGDLVAETPDPRLVAAYLIADPGRSRTTYRPAETATGARGVRGENGEILIPLDGVQLASDVSGLTGPRRAAFHDAEVLTFCHSNDLACATQHDGLAQRVGVRLAQPAAAPLHKLAGRGFKDFGHNPIATLLALAWELAAVSNVVRDYQGETPPFSGEDITGLGVLLHVAAQELLPMAAGIGVPQLPMSLIDLIPHVMNMMPHHLSYFEGGDHPAWTIDGEPVEAWITRDMVTRMRAS
ncbi:hypothetical protein BJP08_04980 [Corynebacterium sp. NML140438]|uniref:cutinase family protein n=1 Tax=Corynebacterium sp. NML140438 TaxID=1906334 RepID=UPI0008FBBB3C|nr:cutinase family protein [Corynebacterium sp. NML140438]OIR42649.1 hypothetical protein BJP08_04980 [Corynebacterium sp. NML140438]